MVVLWYETGSPPVGRIFDVDRGEDAAAAELVFPFARQQDDEASFLNWRHACRRIIG